MCVYYTYSRARANAVQLHAFPAKGLLHQREGNFRARTTSNRYADFERKMRVVLGENIMDGKGNGEDSQKSKLIRLRAFDKY